ncbi:MAG: PIG-L deacetylase family protein [Steroidobacteraceae bacterium]
MQAGNVAVAVSMRGVVDCRNVTGMDVILLPHQDDEIGVFHVIDECVKAGRRLLVIYVTDGAWQRASTSIRNAESMTVLSRLGVAQDRIWFLGQECGVANQNLRLRLEEVHAALLARLSSGPEVSAIYTPAWEGGHPDHDAAALLAVALARRLGSEGKVRQYPMYSAYRCSRRPYTVFNPIREAAPVINERIPLDRRIEHLALCWRYPSQMKTMLGLFPFILAHYARKGVQQYQHLDADIVTRRPHPGALLYERRSSLTWHKFEEDVRVFRTRHLQ